MKCTITTMTTDCQYGNHISTFYNFNDFEVVIVHHRSDWTATNKWEILSGYKKYKTLTEAFRALKTK